ncbi:UDP-glucose 4-epimerase GalE [Fructilactobacillus florum]|uniref:UDP-glucose 4-epimerase GalE n=1 Tax=Fructilactobacillus florum TaxID=640331 RepID=UPI00028C485C|nr:UDP-glucose 4-epimerase GalE [Fructilactobacillus florum]EKK20849.1 UDP-glucose 4-epimerase [Fructilactobacillus florum 2F]
MSILVAGGAGYIGSHMVDRLIEQGYEVVVADNLSTGHRQAVSPAAKFYQGDTRDREFLDQLFATESIDAVIHMDAFSLVSESMEKPLKYFDNNVIGMIVLLEAMHKAEIKKIVFSSTAATYGNPTRVPIQEDDQTQPINPYGESKLMMEHIMKWMEAAYGIRGVALRYFNAAGAKEDGSIGEDHHPETHLIPMVLKVAAGQQDELKIFGDDYDTVDGTNVRDYIHILDLADAHILALNYLQAGKPTASFNLGSSTGFSNQEILAAARRVTGQPIPAKIAPRRPGDPDTLVADSQKARQILGWQPRYDDIEAIIATAWTWKQRHPHGFED